MLQRRYKVQNYPHFLFSNVDKISNYNFINMFFSYTDCLCLSVRTAWSTCQDVCDVCVGVRWLMRVVQMIMNGGGERWIKTKGKQWGRENTKTRKQVKIVDDSVQAPFCNFQFWHPGRQQMSHDPLVYPGAAQWSICFLFVVVFYYCVFVFKWN